MSYRKYFIKTFLMAAVIAPVIATGAMILNIVFFLFLPMHSVDAAYEMIFLLMALSAVCFFLVSAIALSYFFNMYIYRTQLPGGLIKRYMPLMAAFLYYMLVWSILFGISGYSFDHDVWELYTPLTIPYFVINSIINIYGNSSYKVLPVLQAILYIIIFRVFSVSALKHGDALTDRKGLRLGVLLFLLPCFIIGLQFLHRNTKILSYDEEFPEIYEPYPVYNYKPFEEDSELRVPPGAAGISISVDYPRIDSVFSTYPFYASIVRGAYKGLDDMTADDYAQCADAETAYERLVNGDTDIFLGEKPSEEQEEKAAENGVKLSSTLVAKEAFVFFVNAKNPVESLTIGQIQDIYAGNLTNWRSLGGANENIMPFQREKLSGSQAYMSEKVMNGKSLSQPLRLESISMDGDSDRVLQYCNYESAIGYSFRFLADNMYNGGTIKLLAVDGITPDIENIRSGSYPFTIDIYAVTADTESENTEKLIGWLLSDEGREFIESCGYISP